MSTENNAVFVDDVDADFAELDSDVIERSWHDDEGFSDLDNGPDADEDDDGDAGDDAGTDLDSEPDADQQDGDEGGEGDAGDEGAAEDETEPEGAKDGADQSFTLKHLDTVTVVTRDEVVALAQKGMDYDRVRTKYDDLKAKSEVPNTFEQFVREIAERSGMTAEQMMDDTRAQIIAEREGIDKAVAVERLRVKRELESKAAEKPVAEPDVTPEPKIDPVAERRDREIAEFFAVFKGVDPATVPKEVWADVTKGVSLVNAYQAHLNRTEIARLEAARKAAENQRKSTGSRKTAGADKGRDAIDLDWYTD